MEKRLPFRLVLASASPARRELLKRAGYSFDVMPANIDEPTDSGPREPRSLVEHIAWLKAVAVAQRVSQPAAVVLAADTIGWLDGCPIGKPADEADARRILRLLAGREHELWTGVCLWRCSDGVQVSWQEMSRVSFKAMTGPELEQYLATRQWQGCSGAYAILEEDDPFVRVNKGSISNVIGLPMESLERVLAWLAVIDSSPARDLSLD